MAAIRSGNLLPPSPPAEKASARQDQAGQPSASDGGNARANTIAVPKAERAGRGRPARYRSSLITPEQEASDDKPTTASRQADKPSASHHQTRQSSADDRAGNGNGELMEADEAVRAVVRRQTTPRRVGRTAELGRQSCEEARRAGHPYDGIELRLLGCSETKIKDGIAVALLQRQIRRRECQRRL